MRDLEALIRVLKPEYQAPDFWEYLHRFARGDTACVCEWEPGLGKSLLAIVLARYMGATKMLVVGPPISLVSWAEQFEQWWPEAKVLTIRAGKDAKKIKPEHNVVVVSYDLCKSTTAGPAIREWAKGSFGVLDEAQYLRGAATQRTAAAYDTQEGVLVGCHKVMLMSGTLIVSWPDDLWPHLARWMPERITVDGRALDYEGFRDHFLMWRRVPIPGTYAHRIQIYGMTDQRKAELAQRLAGWSIVRTKTEAGLPPLTWRTMRLDLSAGDRMEIDSELNDHLPPRLQTLARALSRDPDNEELAARFAAGLDEYAGMWGVTLRILGVGKAKALSRVIRERLQNTPTRHALGVFSINRKVMDVIDAELKTFGVVRIDGSISTPGRKRVVDQFMDPTGPRVFNGQISACGTALTLTRADTCYFPQLSPIPGENTQAASRFHRIGQQNPVEAIIPIVPGTVDGPLMGLLRKKTTTANAIRGQESQA